MARHKHYLGGHTLIYPTSGERNAVNALTLVESRSPVAAAPMSPPKGKMCGLSYDRQGNPVRATPAELVSELKSLKQLYEKAAAGSRCMPATFHALFYFIGELQSMLMSEGMFFDGKRAYYLLSEVRSWKVKDDFCKYESRVKVEPVESKLSARRKAPVGVKSDAMKAQKEPNKISDRHRRGGNKPKKSYLGQVRTNIFQPNDDAQQGIPLVAEALPVEQVVFNAMRKTSRSDEEAMRRARAYLIFLRESSI